MIDAYNFPYVNSKFLKGNNAENCAVYCQYCQMHRNTTEPDVHNQLIMKSSTRYFSAGSIIADSHEQATGLMVITSGSVGVELPLDSPEADAENGKTLLYVLGRGCADRTHQYWICHQNLCLRTSSL